MISICFRNKFHYSSLLFSVFVLVACGCKHKNSKQDASETDLSEPTIPEIIQQPSSLTVEACGSATLKVVAQGTEPLSYQWSRDGDSLIWAKESSIQVDTNPADNGAKYSVAVTNSVGTVESELVVLTVTAAQPEGLGAKLLWKNASGARKVALSETAVAWTHGDYVYTASLPCASNARILCERENSRVWPEGVLIDGDHVLWTDMSVGQLWVVSILGGPCQKLVDQGSGYRITDVVVVNGRAYWSSFGYANNNIMSVSLGGGGVQIKPVGVEGSRIGGSIETDGEFLYWIDHGTKRINRIAVEGDTVETFTSDQSYVSSILVDGDFLYWTRQTGTDEAPASQILRASLKGSEPEVLVSQSANIWEVKVQAEQMFWKSTLPNTSEGRAIWTSLAGGQDEPSKFVEVENAYGLAVNSTHLYWGEEDIGLNDEKDNGLMRKPL